MTVRFHPEASTELDAAASWYEGEQAGLGIAFLVEVVRATAAIEATPATWPFVRKSRRIQRFLLARFPYAVLYQVVPDAIVVVAVGHTRRRPGYWRARRIP